MVQKLTQPSCKCCPLQSSTPCYNDQQGMLVIGHSRYRCLASAAAQRQVTVQHPKPPAASCNSTGSVNIFCQLLPTWQQARTGAFYRPLHRSQHKQPAAAATAIAMAVLPPLLATAGRCARPCSCHSAAAAVAPAAGVISAVRLQWVLPVTTLQTASCP